MKYQANVLAAIMKNWDQYEKMLGDYAGGSGSAAVEAEKTANSLQGSLNKLSNSWSNLVNNFVSSDGLNTAVKGLNSLLQIVVKLTSFLGTSGSIATALAGFFSAKSNLGLFTSNDAKQFGLNDNFLNQIKSLFSGSLSTKATFSSYSKDLQSNFKKYVSLRNQGVNHDTAVKNVGVLTSEMLEYGSATANASVSTAGFNASLAASTGAMTTATLGAKASAVAMKGLAVAANMALTAGIMLAIQGVMTAYDKLKNYRNDIIKEGQEVTDKYEAQISKTEKRIASLNKNKDTFEMLASGTDNSGKNIGLTTAQYEEYSNIRATILKQNPSLIQGYDAEGNAIANNNTLVEEAIKLQEQKLAVQKRESVNSDNWETVTKGLYGELLDANDDLTDAREKFVKQAVNNGGWFSDKDNISAINEAVQSVTGYSNFINEYGALNGAISNEDMSIILSQSENIKSALTQVDGITSSSVSNISDALDTFASSFGSAFSEANDQVESFLSETATTIPETLDGYADLSDTTKSFISRWITDGISITADDISTEEQRSSLRDNIMALSKDIVDNGDVIGDAYEQFNKAFANTSKQSAVQWEQQVKDQYKRLSDTLSDAGIDMTNKKNRMTLQDMLGVEISGSGDLTLLSTGQNISDMMDKLQEKFKGIKGAKKYLEGLTLDELNDAFQIAVVGAETFTGTLDQLIKRTELLQQSAKNFGGSLSDYASAKETANAGDDYLSMLEALKATKELYDQELYGTDDFKMGAAIFSPTGATDAKNFAENYRKSIRYFTEDKDGLVNFFEDLSKKTDKAGNSFINFDKSTGKINGNIENTAEAAQKMGMGLESFEAVLKRASDYGVDIEFSELSEQYDEAADALDRWAQAWQDGGGIQGDAQGQEIENYRQQLIEFKNAGESIPDYWVKEFEIKINIAESQAELDSALSLYEQQKAENGTAWASSSASQESRTSVISAQEQLNADVSTSASNALQEAGRVYKESVQAEIDRLNNTVREAKTALNQNPTDSNLQVYTSASQARNDYIQKASVETEYSVKADFSSIDEVKAELDKLGKTLGKNNKIKLSADDTEARKVIDKWNKQHPKDKITVIDADDSSANKKLNNINGKKLRSKTFTVDAETASALGAINGVQTKTEALPDGKVRVTATGTDTAIQKCDKVASSVNNIPTSRTSTITIRQVFKTIGQKVAGFFGFATGTAHFGTSHVTGTVNGSAFANGTASGSIGAKKESRNVLVSEVMPEMVVDPRTGQYTIYNSPTMLDRLPKDAIVFNGKQTEEIIKYGHASTFGQSYANGNSATLKGTLGAGGSSKSNSSTKKNTSSTKENTSATKKNTSAKESNTSQTKKNTEKASALEKYLTKVGNRFNFITVSLDRVSRLTDRIANTITDYISSKQKENRLLKQYNAIQKEINTNNKAYTKYKSVASDFANEAIKNAPGTGKTKKQNQERLKKYFQRIREGESFAIPTITNDEMREAVQQYQEYWEAVLSAKDTVQELQNEQRDVFNQWLNMPIEEAQKKIDDLQSSYNSLNKSVKNSYDVLSTWSSVAASGGSAIALLKELNQSRISTASQTVQNKKTARSEARANYSSARESYLEAKKANETAEKNEKKQSKTTASAINKQKGLTSKQKKALTNKINAGQKISTKGLTGNALKQAKAYNKTVDKQASSQKKLNSSYDKFISTRETYVQATTSYNRAKSYLDTLEETQAVQDKYADSPAYEYQNYLLNQQIANKKAQNNVNQVALETAQKNTDKLKAQSDEFEETAFSKQKTVENKASSILASKSNRKKLSASQEKALRNGEIVSTKGITDKKLKKQLEAYNKAVQASTKASSTAEKAAQKYKDSITALDDAINNAQQSEAELAQLMADVAKQSQANIKAYYDARSSYESGTTSSLQAQNDLKSAKGQDLTMDDYNAVISSKQTERDTLTEEAKKMQENLDDLVEKGTIKKYTQEWYEMQAEIDAVNASVVNLDTEIEKLADTAWLDVMYRGFERARAEADALRSSLSSITSVIDESMMFDSETGQLTDYGVTALAMNMKQIDSYKETLQTYLKEREQLNADYEAGKLSDTEYTTKIQENEKNIAESVKNIKSAETTVINIIKNQAKASLDATTKLIDAYKDALQKKKECA